MIPAEADHNERWEESWIIKKLYETEQRKRLSDYELEKGDFVRYILPREAGGLTQKRRYSLSPEKYLVHGHKGYAYVIMAKDGSSLTVPRWRLKRCTDEEFKRHPLAETMPSGASIVLTGPVIGRRGMDELRHMATPAGEEPVWVPRQKNRAADKLEARAEFEERLAAPEPEDLDDRRDETFSEIFHQGHEKGDGLILPSEGNFILSMANPRIEGNFDWINGRLFIPLNSGGPNNVWILIVVEVAEKVATPKFYSPETGGRQTLEGGPTTAGRMPDIREKLNSYLSRNGVSVEYKRGVYPTRLMAPAAREKNLSLVYIAEYLSLLLKNEKIPQNTTGRKDNNPTMNARRLYLLKKKLT
jgi:hypothetical protein